MKLFIDIETYSSVNIKEAGTYKYVESIDFEILLIAYAFDNGPIKVIRLAEGQPMNPDFIRALQNPLIKNWAHNATFERLAFKAIGYDVPLEQWHCSMIKAAYCGLPLKLEDVSKALHLQEKGKLTTGGALIRYFCAPCKPTKSNGFRHYNGPEHSPEKWSLFIEYIINDVEAMREVVNRLERYEIPDFERENYILDQKINGEGIEIDLSFAQNAVNIDSANSARLLNRMKELTGLENPNSLPQLKKWLLDATGQEIKSLTKDTIPEIIKEVEDEVVTEVLKLKLRVSKTSIKKYTRMLTCTCEDNRARGLFQFYGANRTGRWAGRLIQLQNLTRNYIEDLQGARDCVARGDGELAGMLYGDVSSILSQLIRTAFIAKKGCVFAVADFSAIEARVVAWLAGEQWRMDVFNSHGKIYEASAAMMFGVSIEEVTKGSGYRDKGKIAELALGYGGSTGAMLKMGGEAMGLSENEMKDIVEAWRRKSPAIVNFWFEIDRLVKCAIRIPNSEQVYKKGTEQSLVVAYDGQVLTIKLPSGRKLFYYHPTFTKNRWGRESIKYRGIDQDTKQWGWIETYGGKLTENIVQAISRDLLAFSMMNLYDSGYKVCMHVHDEAICEIPDGLDNRTTLQNMCDIMGVRPEWAQQLPLTANGYLTPFYKKD